MDPRTTRTLVALLITASLAVPGAAFAAGPEASSAAPPAAGAGKEAPVDLASLKVSRDEAIAIARRMFSIPAEMGEPNIYVNQSREGSVWNLGFQSPAKRAERINISVGIDAQTGGILHYNRNATDPTRDQAPLTYTRAEAMERASYWLDMLAPAIKPSLRPVENPLGYGYYGGANAVYEFRWARIAERYPVRNDQVTVTVNARTGELVTFSRGWWRTQGFKAPATILEQARAETAYREQVPMMLQYAYFTRPGTENGEWRLVYRPQTEFYPMVSQEGKLLDGSGQPINTVFLNGYKVVPTADKPYQAPAKSLTREEALALAKAAAGRTDEPANANYSEQGTETKARMWNFAWQSKEAGAKGESTNIRVDVDRGVIAGYNNWGPYEPLKEGETPTFTEAQARDIAIQFIRTNRPDLAGNIMILPGEESRTPIERYKLQMAQRRGYSIRFILLKDGIPVSDRQGSLDVDAMTGKVRSFWTSDLTIRDEMPAARGLVKPTEALGSYLKSQGLELTWVQFYAPPMDGKEPQQLDPQLVWAPGQALNVSAIDAKTGAPLDWNGRDLIEAAKRPNDIEGHFAQREIELLWARSIFELKDGKFNPEQQASAGELARWLVLSRGMQPYATYDFAGNLGAGRAAVAEKLARSAQAPYFGAALQNGVILPEDFDVDAAPDSPVSRELFALWAVRAMGYGAIAKMPNHIAMPFVDQAQIGAKYANAVAILHGLGVVKGDAGVTFAPQRQLTRGEAAMILFAVASQIRR